MTKQHKLTRDLTILDFLYDRDIRNCWINEVFVLLLVIHTVCIECGIIERPEVDPKDAFVAFCLLVVTVLPFMGYLYIKYVVGAQE